jgi:putative flavoprotein involved in K+ transport
MDRDAYATRLEAYAADHRIPVQAGTTVTSVSASSSDGGFVIPAKHGDDAVRYEARTVVVASGMLRVPKIPSIGPSLPAGIAQLHSGTYRRPADLPSGAVLIVGSGQSGVQIAEDLLDSGRMVFLSTSAVARLRRRYRGRDALEWLVDADRFYGVPVPRLPDPQVRFQTLWTTSGVGRFGHTVSLQSLADRGAILLGRPVAVDGDRLSLDDSVGANIAFGDRRSAEFNAELTTIVESAGLTPPPLEHDPADSPHPDPLSVRSPSELDLRVAGVGTVIWATGFGGDLSYLDAPVLDERGVPMHEHGVAKFPGIFFVGFPWLWTRKSGIILGVDEDAAFIADRVADRLAIGRAHGEC